MKKRILILTLFISTSLVFAQKASDLFNSNNVKVSWLGVDFSHVKIIGNFTEFEDAGSKSPNKIRKDYFPGWNNLILNESDKYDLEGMLRKSNINYDIEMIMEKNSNTPLENIKEYNTPNYSQNDIKQFVNEYEIKNGEGIGIVFIAECLNKNREEAFFHFVAINMETKEVLIQKRMRGRPKGFGLRNYWAGSIYEIIKDIKSSYYKKWKAEYR